MNREVVVIGGGIAGLSAAVHLTLAGRRVTLFEQSPRLGGRATAFVDRQSGETVDNGQHVLFGCYREAYELMRVLGTEHLVPLQPRLDLTMVDSRGRQATLRCAALPPPWHLIAAVLRWPVLPAGDRAAARFIWPVLQAARRGTPAAVAAGVPPGATVDAWLAAKRQPAEIRRWLWHPLTFAALNQPAEVAGAKEFVRVLAELFGPRLEDSAVGLPAAPLDEIFARPAREFIETRGGRVHLRASAQVVTDGRCVRGVRTRDELVDTDTVVAAVPWHAFGQLWAGGVPEGIGPVAERAAAMRSSPIVTTNLWLDGPVMRAPFLGFVDGTMHWVFDKGALFGRDARHLSLVASGAEDLAARENDEITTVALEDLHRALPESRGRRLVRSLVVREHRATFSLAPGGPERPGLETALAGCYLAGDWTDTGLPATIEGAATSGRRAAEAVIAAEKRRRH